jgi:Flp pilus assembly protein TadG
MMDPEAGKMLPLAKKVEGDGQSLVELALLLPILILIMAGALDLARVYDAYTSITNASREGARYGAANPTDNSGIASAVNRELTSTGISGVTVSEACSTYSANTPVDCGVANTGDRITVSVSYPFRFVTGLIIGLSSISMSNSATMPVAN